MLFRKEAVDSNRIKLYGNILIVSPIAFKIISLLLAFIVITAFVLLAYGTFSRVETVRGIIVPTKGIVRVYPGIAGTITELLMHENQTIVANETLGRIVASQVALDLGTSGAAKLNFVERQLANIDEQITRMRELHTHEVGDIEAQIRQARGTIEHRAALMVVQQEILHRTQKSFARASELAGKQLATDQSVDERGLAVLVQQKTVRQHAQSSADQNSKLEDLLRQLKRMPIEFNLSHTKLNGERNNLIRERQELVGEKAASILAPISGRISTILVSQGQNVTPQQPLFSILPSESSLQVELYVPSRAVGFIEEGQQVRLLLDAFPYQRFGAKSGVIISSTSSVISPSDNSTPIAITEPVYRIKVELEDLNISAYDRDLPLQPGMLLNANIILEKRSFLGWLLEPILAVGRR